MRPTYSANRIALQLHATTGSIMLALGLLQFPTSIRRRFPRFHRNLGKVWVALAIPTSGGALAYLATVPPEEVFSGRVFHLALVGLAVALAVATYMAYVTARRRRFGAHRAWMLQAYFYILSAPILRMTWIAVYQANDDMNQWDNNLYAVGITTAAIALGPLMWISGSREPHRLRETQTNGVIDRFATLGSTAPLTVGLIALVAGVVTPVDTRFGPALPGNLFTFGLMLAIAVGIHHYCARRDDRVLDRAWATMLAGIALIPATTAVATGALWLTGWSMADAVPAAGLGAFFLNPLVAFAWIIHRRPTVAGSQGSGELQSDDTDLVEPVR